MPNPDYLRESMVRGAAENGPAVENWQRTPPGLDTGNYCAYNQTRGRFLSAEVEVGDFSGVDLDNRLATLRPESGVAFWIVPFRGISLTSARLPFDLLYLDPNCTVIDAVESFPISRTSESSHPAASVLALPAESISSTGTLSGDQLILGAPSEIKQRLLQLSESGVRVHVEQNLSAGESSAAAVSPPVQAGPGQVLRWEDHSQPKSPGELSPATEPSNSVLRIAKATKNWLRRWWDKGRPEPRNQPREALPWISAYFFTGGAPVAFGVRNISSSGMFVFTNERWYLGTIIRMTLSDKREPIAARSITVNAMVVRWGNDGVGLNFIFQDEKKSRRDEPPPDNAPLVDVTEKQLKEFVRRVKSDMS